MNIIIPMAGSGKRLRPHTLTTPKPLFPLAGQPIVERLIRALSGMYPGKIGEIAYVIGPHFGQAVEAQLLEVAQHLGTTGRIYYQEEPHGTAHAIACAQPALEGEILIAFADTLFIADTPGDTSQDGTIWVKQVKDPTAFGVVTLDADGYIEALVEKPDTFVSDLAIIGIYHLRDGAALMREIQRLFDQDLRSKGEYQLTDALAALQRQGARFVPGQVREWMDCGNREAVIDTLTRLLMEYPELSTTSPDARLQNAVVIPPCFIDAEATVMNSVIGPFVSVGKNAAVVDCVLKETIVQASGSVAGVHLHRSIIGAHATVREEAQILDFGDYSRQLGH